LTSYSRSIDLEKCDVWNVRIRIEHCIFTCSNPELSPELPGLFSALKVELDGNDILEALGERRFLEAAPEVTECDAWERCSRLGVLIRVLVVSLIEGSKVVDQFSV
jgi:hypothetical protein